MKNNRRDFIKLMAIGAAGMTLSPRSGLAQSTSPRRFITDSHQHYNTSPDYIERGNERQEQEQEQEQEQFG